MKAGRKQRTVSSNRSGKAVIRAIFVSICLLPAVFLLSGSQAQQPAQLWRIGFLAVAPLSTLEQRTEAFRQGMRELGYAEGKNIFIDWRSAEGIQDRVSKLAAELVRLKVDIIITAGSRATQSAKTATVTIPIIMAQDPDPLANGFVASLGRPGGNITGLSTLAPELSGKRLELLKEIVPKLSRVAVFGTSTSIEDKKSLEEIKVVAGAMKVQIEYRDILTGKDIEPGFVAATKTRADAILWTVSGSVFRPHRNQVLELAEKSRLPVIYNSAESVDAGGLIAYGVNGSELYRRAATYVDKILKGAKPADLPVEQPTKFELIINLKTAKQIGLTIPPNVLARADRIIK
jgi:putative tryptophan/tyrosine transport system substrate-binding protein